MNKEEFIARRGEAAYEKKLEQNHQRALDNPDRVREYHEEHGRKGGKYYLKWRKYQITGLRSARNVIRTMHRRHWRNYKTIIAPDSQIHHEWVPGTSNYNGVALVEKDQHRHGIIDVIQILDGDITLLTEKEIRERC